MKYNQYELYIWTEQDKSKQTVCIFHGIYLLLHRVR